MRMKISRHTGGFFSACGRKKIFLREEMNFLPYENKFLCGRKNISLREKINLYTGRNKFSCGRKFTGIREKINFFPYKNLRSTITVRWIRATAWLEVGTHGSCVRFYFSWQLTSKRVNKLIVARHVGTHGPCVRSNKHVHALGNPPWTDARAVRPYFFTAK